MTARTDHERAEFEKWLGIKPCGAAHDFGWAAWMARAALSATPAEKSNSVEFDGIKTARPVVLPEPAATTTRYDGSLIWQSGLNGSVEKFGAKLYTEQQVRALLATGGQAQAEHIKALIEVSRMPNQEHVADAHNAAVRHLRAIAAAKEQE